MAVVETLTKGGAVMATGGLVSDLIIFNDPMYSTLSIVGAVVSATGVLHEVFHDDDKRSVPAILSEVLKGAMIGLLAIPLWYLVLSSIGSTIVQKAIDIEGACKIADSVWLMVSFAMAWYTVPLFNFIVYKVKIKSKDI